MPPSVSIDSTALVASTAVVGAPHRPLLGVPASLAPGPTVVGPDCWVGHACVVGEGVRLGRGTILDHGARIDANATLGENVLLLYGGQVGAEATIGNGAIVGGFVAERASVGARSRIFGSLIHTQHDPALDWDDPRAVEPSPEVHDEAFVGWGACVIGGVTIGRRAYVCANALVTRSVSANHIASGVNHVVPPTMWPGALSESTFLR